MQTSPEFTAEQLSEILSYKQHFPFRRIFGALSPEGEFQVIAKPTSHRANSLARKGWHVAEAK